MFMTNYLFVAEAGGTVCLIGTVNSKTVQTTTVELARKGEVQTASGTIYQLGVPHASMWEYKLQMARPQQYANLEKANDSDNWCRVNKKRIVVGRFSFPVPETRNPPIGTAYYITDISMDSGGYTWVGDAFDRKYFEAGRVHLTWEGAKEHLAALEAVSLGNWQ